MIVCVSSCCVACTGHASIGPYSTPPCNARAQRFLSLLPKELSSRVLPWAGAGHVYFASTLYVANEGGVFVEFCRCCRVRLGQKRCDPRMHILLCKHACVRGYLHDTTHTLLLSNFNVCLCATRGTCIIAARALPPRPPGFACLVQRPLSSKPTSGSSMH